MGKPRRQIRKNNHKNKVKNKGLGVGVCLSIPAILQPGWLRQRETSAGYMTRLCLKTNKMKLHARVDGGLSGDTADKFNRRDLVPSNRAGAWMPL